MLNGRQGFWTLLSSVMVRTHGGRVLKMTDSDSLLFSPSIHGRAEFEDLKLFSVADRRTGQRHAPSSWPDGELVSPSHSPQLQDRAVDGERHWLRKPRN